MKSKWQPGDLFLSMFDFWEMELIVSNFKEYYNMVQSVETEILLMQIGFDDDIDL